MSWFNELLEPQHANAKSNLVSKLIELRHEPTGCITRASDTRLCLDKRSTPSITNLPQRFEPYHAAMLKANKMIPDTVPPRLPQAWRQVQKKRWADVDLDKDATWVASHLCRNKRCMNADHIVWEPNWFNRLRDNCPGGDDCDHRPHKCIQAHRKKGEIYDWTTLATAD